jgi:hypothetical protein
MKLTLKTTSLCASLAAFTLAFGLSATAQPQSADAAFNESRWFLQNVCLAKANQELGNADWAKYNAEAKESRERLRNSGVPENHLREMEASTTNIIKASFDGGNGSTKLCIQWYNT